MQQQVVLCNAHGVKSSDDAAFALDGMNHEYRDDIRQQYEDDYTRDHADFDIDKLIALCRKDSRIIPLLEEHGKI